MSCPCRICKLPNAQEVWEALPARGKNSTIKLSGIPRASFYAALDKHELHRTSALGLPSKKEMAQAIEAFPTDLKSAEPEDLLWVVARQLCIIGTSGKPTDQARTTALKEARETILRITELRSAKKPDVTDPTKEEAELQKTLMEKLQTYLPVDPPPALTPSAVVHPAPPPSPGTEAGFVH